MSGKAAHEASALSSPTPEGGDSVHPDDPADLQTQHYDVIIFPGVKHVAGGFAARFYITTPY
ncbi:MAG: hypothetical protein L6Q98_01800 [Anaerolineae bacterium]|nr:hypothetical protein [Anaerolineae bacterium]NUQ05162.1 hypothetical protein [Anaerolineae bacterium]